LPEELHDSWVKIVAAGLKPVIGNNRYGVYVGQDNSGPRKKPTLVTDDNAEQFQQSHTNEPPKYRFRLLAFQEMRPGIEPSYLVDELIPSTGLVLIWGKQKTLKSFWVLDIMLHVALNWTYRDHAVRPLPGP
jgi:hypothetical protein